MSGVGKRREAPPQRAVTAAKDRSGLSDETKKRLAEMGAYEHRRTQVAPIPGYTDGIEFTDEMIAAGALKIQGMTGLESYHWATTVAQAVYAAMSKLAPQSKGQSSKRDSATRRTGLRNRASEGPHKPSAA